MLIGKWVASYLILLLIAVPISGCLGVRTPETVSPTPPAVMLDYHRTGGIAGFDDRLVIFDNGIVVIATGAVSHEFAVNQSELSRIHRVFDAAEFETLQGSYTSRYRGADLIQYRITFQNKTIITEDTAIPGTLQPVITELNSILGTGRTPNLISGSFAGIST